MHKLFWNVTNAYSAYTFKKALFQVQAFGGLGAVKWFKDIGPLDRWTRWQFDPTLSSGENTNNFVESFNNTIGVERSYPILTLLEGVRRIAMVRHATRQQLAEQWPDEGICPNIIFQLRKLTKDSRVCQAYPSGRGTFEVHDGRATLPVSIHARTCLCGSWKISGIPCKHGIKAILSEGKDPVDYVNEWYSVAKYKQAYSGNIDPVPDQDHWPHVPDVPELIPPSMKRSVGRPSRNRRREEGGPTAKKAASQQGRTKNQQAKARMKAHNPMQPDPAAISLIDMMVLGTQDQWVEGNSNQASESQPSTSRKRRNTGKKASNTADQNLIEIMMLGSQPSQPMNTQE